METNRALEAIDQGLRSVGSDLKSAFQEFSTWNVFTDMRANEDRFYEEGALYPRVELSGLHEPDSTGVTSALRFYGPDIPAARFPAHLAPTTYASYRIPPCTADSASISPAYPENGAFPWRAAGPVTRTRS